MTPPGGCLPPPGGRLPLRGRWTGQSPGRMRGNNLTVLKLFDEWQSFILERNRKVSLFDGVDFVRLACCPSSVRACGPATLSVGEGFLRRGLQPGSAYRPTPTLSLREGFYLPSSTGWICRPWRAAFIVSWIDPNSATRDQGFFSQSSCRKGTK